MLCFRKKIVDDPSQDLFNSVDLLIRWNESVVCSLLVNTAENQACVRASLRGGLSHFEQNK